jgi:mRNA interferase RelE/StbE
MRKIVQTKTFEKAIKKAHPNEKKAVDQVIRKIMIAPERGDRKKGNLAGVYTQTFGLHGAQFRLAYRFDEDTIELLSFGPRENFYG